MTWASWLLAAAILILAAGTYRYSLWRHPTRACHGCRGAGKHAGAVWTYATGPCTVRTLLPPRARCDGGRVPRYGRRVMQLDKGK